MQENNIPTWGFTYRDIGGTISTKSFEAISWTRALQEFVYFLKGTGFELDSSSVQINNQHEDSHNWFGNYCEDIDTEVENWSHPDGTDLSMHFCPSFEGKPEDCAFKHEEDPEIQDLITAVDSLTTQIQELNYHKQQEMELQQVVQDVSQGMYDMADALRYIQGEQD